MCVTKGIHMNAVSKALGLALLALGATPSHAINPQPLPPRHVDSRINPQPLPPTQAGSRVRIAINPQPLPPLASDRSLQYATPKPYIGETEKNQR
jgi:hypothetical protein